jgi:hypothetical protein
MKRSESILLVFLSGLLMLLIPQIVLSQADSLSVVQEAETTGTVYAGSRHSLYTGMGYGSNMIYLGSTISQDQPFGYGSLTYGFNNEFFATVSAIHLSGLDPFVAFYTGSLSYSHVFNSWFDISTGLYRYQVAPSLADTLFSNFTYGDLTLGFDWRLIYSKISVGGLISDENRIFFQLRNSRYFQTPEIFNGKANISFDPYINLLFGTLIEVETITGTTVTISPPYRKWRTDGQGTTSTVYSRKFGIMDIDFGLPVAINTDFMTIEAEAGYVLPVYEDPDFPGTKGFILLLSGYFRIF